MYYALIHIKKLKLGKGKQHSQDLIIRKWQCVDLNLDLGCVCVYIYLYIYISHVLHCIFCVASSSLCLLEEKDVFTLYELVYAECSVQI